MIDPRYTGVEPSVLRMAVDVVRALIQAGELIPDDREEAVARLNALHAKAEQMASGEGDATRGLAGAEVGHSSISQDAITCLECGAGYKQLSQHLPQHGLTAQAYRAKYNLPRTLPLAARATTARRRQAMQVSRPWEQRQGR